MKKQAPEEVAHRIDAYLAENNITATKFRAARTLPSADIAIQTTNQEEAEKLRGEDSWIRVLESKARWRGSDSALLRWEFLSQKSTWRNQRKRRKNSHAKC